MALGAISDILRELYFVVKQSAVVVAGLGQHLAHVNFVDVVGQVADRHAVDAGGRARIAGCRGGGFHLTVLALLRVADHTVFGLIAAATMKAGARVAGRVARNAAKLRVAFVALDGGGNVAPRVGHSLARGGDEVIDHIDRLCHRYAGSALNTIGGVGSGAGCVA